MFVCFCFLVVISLTVSAVALVPLLRICTTFCTWNFIFQYIIVFTRCFLIWTNLCCVVRSMNTTWRNLPATKINQTASFHFHLCTESEIGTFHFSILVLGKNVEKTRDYFVVFFSFSVLFLKNVWTKDTRIFLLDDRQDSDYWPTDTQSELLSWHLCCCVMSTWRCQYWRKHSPSTARMLAESKCLLTTWKHSFFRQMWWVSLGDILS